jgi:small-conductance mechanosensitive channel
MEWKSIEAPWEWLQSVGILAGFLLAALTASLFFGRVVGPIVRRSITDLDDRIVKTLRSLVSWALVLVGIYYATVSLPWAKNNPHIADLLGRGMGIAWLLLALVSTLRIFNALVTWQVHRLTEGDTTRRNIVHQATLFRKVVNVLVLALGLIYLLRTAGADISPLLASGAIGGLAIELAAQDT